MKNKMTQFESFVRHTFAAAVDASGMMPDPLCDVEWVVLEGAEPIWAQPPPKPPMEEGEPCDPRYPADWRTWRTYRFVR